MKFHAVVPPQCSWLVPEDVGLMAFADIALRDPDYMREYALRRDVIMDNQIYEGQQPLGPADLKFVLQVVKPSLAIVPDMRGDADMTVQMGMGYESTLSTMDMNFAGVLQGTKIADMNRCLAFWLHPDRYWVTHIAIPIAVPGRTWSRDRTFMEYKDGIERVGKKIHFLGIERWPYTAESEAHPIVESLDTAEATNATLWGVDLNRVINTSPVPVTLNLRRPPEFMTWPGYRHILEERKELFWRNLQWLNQRLRWKGLDLTVTPEASLEGVSMLSE